MDGESDPIPLSALQHAVYCMRQAALIHLERLWAENRFTAEGHVRPDGRVIYDRYLRKVKAPEDSKYAWDYLRVLAKIPAEEAFRALGTTGCEEARAP